MRACLLSTFGALLLGIAGASCAKGSDFMGVGGGAGGSASTGSTMSTSSTSSGATSSSTSGSGSTSSSSSSGSTSSSSSSSSGSGCSGTPCKLTTPQCGCASGEACTVESYTVTCATPGSDAVNQACGTSTADQCQAGAVCVSASATAGQCLKFCDADSQCSGGLCVITLADGPNSTTSIPNVTLCSPHCNPIGGTGCPSGATCELGREDTGQMRWFGLCAPSGSKTQNAGCTAGMDDCAVGYTCLDPDGTGSATPVCMKYCNADLGTGCAAGLTCYPLTDNNTSLPIVIDGVSVGVCYL